jgi:hypothetical protein
MENRQTKIKLPSINNLQQIKKEETFDKTNHNNSYLFNEFVCNFGFFWYEWTSLKLE